MPFARLPWKNRLWYSYNDYLSARFGEKVYKVTVSAGFTCPTRDGTKGSFGCAFCDERGSASFSSSERAALAVRSQLEKAIPFVSRRFRARKYLAYFQSFTNTYGPLPYLREVYDGALGVPNVVGMAVGTRPDCVPTDVLALLNGYGRSRYVSLELGLQSFDDETLAFYERGHTVAESVDAVTRALRFPNLHLSVHLMFGAPGEVGRLREVAVDAARRCNALGVHGVKIHHLMVLKNTVLARRYAENPWPLVSMEEYNEAAEAFLDHLSPSIHVDRTHALASHFDELVGPAWSAERFGAINKLQQEMREHGSFQGKALGEIPS